MVFGFSIEWDKSSWNFVSHDVNALAAPVVRQHYTSDVGIYMILQYTCSLIMTRCWDRAHKLIDFTYLYIELLYMQFFLRGTVEMKLYCVKSYWKEIHCEGWPEIVTYDKR